jgi:hypothetical protein
MIGTRALLLTLAVASSGCMSMYYRKAKQDPGPHDSVLSVVTIGAAGDALVGGIAGGIHGYADEGTTDWTVFALAYGGVLLVADVITLLIMTDADGTR